MIKGRVLNKYKKKHKDVPAINIMRPSKYGNPYILNKHGTRDEVVAKYKEYVLRQIATGKWSVQELADLHGQNLLCCCKPKLCHGDVLIDVAEKCYNHLNVKTFG